MSDGIIYDEEWPQEVLGSQKDIKKLLKEEQFLGYLTVIVTKGGPGPLGIHLITTSNLKVPRYQDMVLKVVERWHKKKVKERKNENV